MSSNKQDDAASRDDEAAGDDRQTDPGAIDPGQIDSGQIDSGQIDGGTSSEHVGAAGNSGPPGASAPSAGANNDATSVPAAVRYKEIAATAASAADRMRKLEGDRIAELSGEVAAGRERIEEAERQRAEVEESVRERWDAAREALWDERWMRVPPMPEPDTTAPAATPEESLRLVRAAYRDLYDALGKRRWSGAFKSRRGRQDD